MPTAYDTWLEGDGGVDEKEEVRMIGHKYVAVPYTVTIDRRERYSGEREQWDRDALRQKCFEQSARTVAGALAEFNEGDAYARAEMADAQDRETGPEFSFMYGSAR